MFKKILERLGWDFNSYSLLSIKNKNALLKFMVDRAPDGSLWSISDLEGNNFEQLKPFEWPGHISHKPGDGIVVVLAPENKGRIKEIIDKIDFDKECTHQGIRPKNGGRFFDSNDYLLESCTYVSKKISKDDIRALMQQGIALFKDV